MKKRTYSDSGIGNVNVSQLSTIKIMVRPVQMSAIPVISSLSQVRKNSSKIKSVSSKLAGKVVDFCSFYGIELDELNQQSIYNEFVSILSSRDYSTQCVLVEVPYIEEPSGDDDSGKDKENKVKNILLAKLMHRLLQVLYENKIRITTQKYERIHLKAKKLLSGIIVHNTNLSIQEMSVRPTGADFIVSAARLCGKNNPYIIRYERSKRRGDNKRIKTRGQKLRRR